ncbi:MAG: collagen-binding domain-containing protein [Myxococcales bacterium]
MRLVHGLLASTALLATVGCSTSDDEHVARTGQPTVTPQSLTLSLPKGALLQQQALASTAALSLAPNASVVPSATGLGEIASLGLTNIGADAATGSVRSQGKVSLADRARVDGFIQTTTTPSKGSGVVITGSVTTNETFTPPTTLTFSVAFPGGATIDLQKNQQRALNPGAYASVSVKSGAKLSLSAGKYRLTSLSTEPGSTLAVDTRGGPVFVYTESDLTLKGGVSYTGDDASLLFVQAGISTVNLEAPFTGSVLAPKAAVRLAPVTGPGFRGSFFGKGVSVEAGTKVTLLPFAHWGVLFPPVPFVNCVNQIAPGSYVALFGTRNVLDFAVTVPLGVDNALSPVPTPATVPPAVFVSGENRTALWAPIGSGALTWSVRGASATATPSSTACGPEAYPEPPISGTPRGDHASPPLALKRKPAPYFDPPPAPAPPPPPAPASSTTKAAPPPAPALSPPFVFRITGGTNGTDGFLASRDLNAEVTIDGTGAGTKDVYDDGCVFGLDSCPYGEPFSANVEFSVPVSIKTAVVSVHVKLIEHDSGSKDETIADVTFTVDNTTGLPSIPTVINGVDSWQVFFEVEATGSLPPVAAEPRLCTTLNAAFVDEGFGEDFVGTPVVGQDYKSYPAAFVMFSLRVESPYGLGTAGGFLDADGCVPLGSIPKEAYAFLAGADPTLRGQGSLDLFLTVDTSALQRPDGVRYNLFNEPGLARTETHFSVQPSWGPLSGWTKSGLWMLPPAQINVPSQMLTPITNMAVSISELLSREDMAIPSDDPATPGINEGTYRVDYGDGCHFTDTAGNGFIDSCFSPADDLLFVGPGNRPVNPASCSADSDCPSVQVCLDARGRVACGGGSGCLCSWPDQSRWKFVTLHEAGHQVQARALGSTSGASYVFDCPQGTTCPGKKSGDPMQPTKLADPPFVDSMSPLCGCQHVAAANSLHCLQSIERFDNAQSEGFAQFFASKSWNQPEGGGCKFVYYKEFLNTDCLPGSTCVPFSTGPGTPSLQSNLPPLGISCEQQFKWRNNHCPLSPTSEMSTELDWLGFLWNLNTNGPSKTSMANLFAIYRNTCNPLPAPAAGSPGGKCVGEETLAWSTRPPQPNVPRVACTAGGTACTSNVCLNEATWKRCKAGDAACSCQTEPAFGVVNGAALFYANDPVRLQHLTDAGRLYGVTEALAP